MNTEIQPGDERYAYRLLATGLGLTDEEVDQVVSAACGEVCSMAELVNWNRKQVRLDKRIDALQMARQVN